jgi:single-strand DNA-binding protein
VLARQLRGSPPARAANGRGAGRTGRTGKPRGRRNRFYTNRNGEKIEQTDFFNVNAWRSVAVNVAESLTTGARVLVAGRLQARNWETGDGAKRSTVEIDAEEVAACLRFATMAITKATNAGGPDEAQDQGEQVPA